MIGLLDPRPSRELGALYRQLEHLVSAGLPPLQAAGALDPRAFGEPARSAIAAVQQAWRSGRHLSEGLRGLGARLPAFHVALLAAGEASGTLVRVLSALSEACAAESAQRWAAWRALLYPLILTQAIAWILPAPLLVKAGPGAYLTSALPMSLWPLALVAGVSWHVHRARGGDARAAGVLARVPSARDLLRLGSQSRACRALALSTGAGLGLPQSFAAAATAAGAGEVGEAVRRAAARIARGGSVTESLVTEGALDGVPAALAKEGELTGRLDGSLMRAAAWLDDQLQRKLAMRIKLTGAISYVIAATYIFAQYGRAMT